MQKIFRQLFTVLMIVSFQHQALAKLSTEDLISTRSFTELPYSQAISAVQQVSPMSDKNLATMNNTYAQLKKSGHKNPTFTDVFEKALQTPKVGDEVASELIAICLIAIGGMGVTAYTFSKTQDVMDKYIAQKTRQYIQDVRCRNNLSQIMEKASTPSQTAAVESSIQL